MILQELISQIKNYLETTDYHERMDDIEYLKLLTKADACAWLRRRHRKL